MSNISSTTQYHKELERILSEPGKDDALFEAIVNAPFHDKLQATNLDLGIVVLLLVNKKDSTIDRVALSKTEHAEWAVRMSPIPFHDIKIPINAKKNTIVQAIKSGEAQITVDWAYLFTPALAPEAARFNQSGAGIACSYVCPLKGVRDGGAMIYSYYQPPENIGKKQRDFMSMYCKLAKKALLSNG